MRWDRFFEDLEDQLASEWEAERAALDTEAERLRLARVGLRERLVAAADREPGGAPPSIEFTDGTTVNAAITGVGADWVALDPGTRTGAILAPTASLISIGMPHADLLRSARPATARGSSLAERMTLGFVLRDVARRRLPVTAHLVGGRALTGTIDRAAADHFDIALHEAGAARRADSVSGHRLVPFTALAWLRIESAAAIL